MGCHTWYRKPLVKGKENVQEYLRGEIDERRKKKWWTEAYEKEALVKLAAIDALDIEMDELLLDELQDTYGSARLLFINGEPVIFTEADPFSIDDPRIGGYPDTIIQSAEQMFKAMETGLVNWEGKRYEFYWDKSREEFIRNNIVDFFNEHPDGIIEFG